MIFVTTIAHTARAFALAIQFIIHLKTIIYLSFLLIFTMALVSVSIIFYNIIATALPNIRLVRRHFCGHPIVLLALLTLDDGAEAGLSN